MGRQLSGGMKGMWKKYTNNEICVDNRLGVNNANRVPEIVGVDVGEPNDPEALHRTEHGLFEHTVSCGPNNVLGKDDQAIKCQHLIATTKEACIPTNETVCCDDSFRGDKSENVQDSLDLKFTWYHVEFFGGNVVGAPIVTETTSPTTLFS